MSQTNKIATKINELTEEMALEPQNVPINALRYIRRAILNFQERKFSNAINDCTKAIELNPKEADAYWCRGLSNMQIPNNVKAINDFTKAIEINPKDIRSYLKRGSCYIKTKEYTKAINDFSEVVKCEPTNANAYYWLGICYETKENYEEAIKNYTKSIELDPEDSDLYLQRGYTFLYLNNYSKALNDFTRAIELDDRNINKLLDGQLKEISIKLLPAINDYDRAIEFPEEELECFLKSSYDTIIEKFPNVADGYLHRGTYFMANGQYNHAIEDFNGYIKLNHRNNYAYFLRGICYHALQEVDKANEDFYKAILPINNSSTHPLLNEKSNLNLITNNKTIKNLQLIKEQLGNYPLINHTFDYSIFLGFVGQNSSIEIMLKSLEIFFDAKLNEEISFAIYLDELNFEENRLPENLQNVLNRIFYNYPEFENSLDHVLNRDGKEIFMINTKLSFLRDFARRCLKDDIWWHFDLEYDEEHGLHGLSSQEEINQQFNFTQTYIHLSESLQRQFVEEKAKVVIEERNRIIKNQAHDIKNILSSIISPLMYLQRRIHKPQIEQALKQVDVLSKMVNATSLSYSGSPEDFFYDAQDNDKGINLKDMMITSLESSVGNIVEDIAYYSSFREQYFPDDLREEVLAEYRELQAIPSSERLTALKKFIEKYMCKLKIDFGKSDTFVLGDKKSSGVKMLALFNELIFNAIKYAAFVDKNKRFVSICFVNDDKNVYLKVKNSYAGHSEIKTTGTGILIIDNLIEVMQGKVSRVRTEDSHFITEIEFANFWKGGNSG